MPILHGLQVAKSVQKLSAEHLHCIPNEASGEMTCPEYQRLLQLYEAALRHWGRVMWSANAGVPGIPEHLASEMKQSAYFERNEAHKRMLAHKQSCSACNPRLRVVPKQ